MNNWIAGADRRAVSDGRIYCTSMLFWVVFWKIPVLVTNQSGESGDVPDWGCGVTSENSPDNVHMQTVSRGRSKCPRCGLKIEHLSEILGFFRRDRLEARDFSRLGWRSGCPWFKSHSIRVQPLYGGWESGPLKIFIDPLILDRIFIDLPPIVDSDQRNDQQWTEMDIKLHKRTRDLSN